MRDVPKPVVSVVIPARNAAATLEGTLRGLASQDLTDTFEVVVVDDGSTDETAAIAAASSVVTRVIRRPPGGDGAGAARNDGAQASRASVLAFTDADCVPTAAWLREGVAAIEDADLVQGAVAPEPAQTLWPFDHTVWVRERTGLFEAANLFVSRAAFDAAGGFEDVAATGRGRPFGEDTWLGWRLERQGARYRFAPDALVHHEVVRRGPAAYVAERWRRSLFPLLAVRIPELRRERFFLRRFLNRRSAAFDLALAGLLAVPASGAPVAGLLAVPYVAQLIRGAIGWRRWAPVVLPVHLAADAVGLIALARGSVAARSVLL